MITEDDIQTIDRFFNNQSTKRFLDTRSSVHGVTEAWNRIKEHNNLISDIPKCQGKCTCSHGMNDPTKTSKRDHVSELWRYGPLNALPD
jgi:hypothetical protein